MEPLTINSESVSKELEQFIGQTFSKAGFDRAVVALSGGIDSSTAAYLAQRALGAENIWGINMPYRTSSPQSAGDAQLVAHELGINFLTVEITEMIDAYFKQFPDADRIRCGNKMARERMTILYDQSAALRALVLGSGNKTERLLGYCTLHGDAACALAPLGDLYKTQVRELARFLGVPEHIIQKVPTADLWPGQSDEAELGFTYEEVDKLLYFMIEKRYTFAELKGLGFTDAFIKQVMDRIRKSQHKRCLPSIPRINQGVMEAISH
jgi:NAD+ synthase